MNLEEQRFSFQFECLFDNDKYGNSPTELFRRFRDELCDDLTTFYTTLYELKGITRRPGCIGMMLIVRGKTVGWALKARDTVLEWNVFSVVNVSLFFELAPDLSIILEHDLGIKVQ